MRTYIASIIIAVCLLILYIIGHSTEEPITFSTTLSTLVIIGIALGLLVVLILTVRGKMVGRRVVFTFVGVSLSLPFLMQFEMPIPVTSDVERLYQALEDLPAGSRVLAAFDYDPPSAPELQPMADAFMAYAFENDLKVIIMGLWPQGPQQAQLAVEAALERPQIQAKNIEYGVDYVNLGFQAGNEFVIQRMGSSFRGMFARDSRDIPYDELPILKGVENFSNVDFVMNFSAGKPGTQEWVQIAVDRFGVELGAGNTAVQAPGMYPFLKAGQLVGLLGGMSGAAEFETITEERGQAMTFMSAQTFAHAVIIAFIIIGNMNLLLARKKRE
jgi:hypothetical protein